MMADSLTIAYTAGDGTRYRIEYHDDPSGGYTRAVEERIEGGWRPVGTEDVTDLDVDLDGEGDTKVGP